MQYIQEHIDRKNNLKSLNFSDATQIPEVKRKVPAIATASTSSQTSPALSPSVDPGTRKVSAKDLTSDKVGENYWEVLAEQRRAALEESLSENHELYERIATLEDELNQSKTTLAETKNLVEVLTEMLEETEDDANITMSSEIDKTEQAYKDGDAS